nr:DNA topoisomerase 2-alpha [Saimiri boliviensis boliviensis]
MEVSPLQPVNENMQVNKIKKNEDAKKRLSVERIYQKKTQLEHILLRPDTYIGSVELVTQQMWVYDEDVGINYREVTFVPGLYKIFDEILVNAADNKQRDPKMSCIRVTIDPENNLISIWNNGKGIPVVEHKVEKMYVPALIFGQLLTSSNYDDDEKKVTGGRNGYGAKLCNIFSTKFTVETACREYKKMFKQTWMDNMGRAGEMELKPFNGEDYTCITFQPDLSKFKMQSLDKDIVALMVRRAYDIAGSTKDVKVFLNGNKLPVKGFRSYVDMYLKDKLDETGNPLKVVHEQVNHRWEVCLTMSEKGFQQISFVNSIATSKGGRHVDYVADQIVTKLVDVVKKKNKGGVAVKAHQVKNHMWIFVNALIENPTFDSQTKENMTLQPKSFGSTCHLSEKFIKAAIGCGIVESILNWVKFKAQVQLNKKCSAVKHNRIKGIPKLDDANDAGLVPQDYLYGQTTTYLTYNDFINKELILFSNSDNERSIPSMVDGLKPGQRKVLFTCFKRNDKREVKVAQLAGSVAEMSSYHHGEMSLMMTIINLAQNFVGSNNLNLLQPIGQFGTRLHGGKDSASPRYIFTMLSSLTRLLFPPKDDHTLKFLYDDNQRVEPEWYIPIIPMVLINGAEGIGTGWSCKIPNFDVREVVNNIRRLMDGEEPLPMLPSYKNFKGTIEELAPNQYVISGEVAILNSTTIEISELPVRTWTQTYKEQVLEPMLNGTEKTPPLITDYREYHTDTTVKFVVKMTEEKLAEAERVGLHKVFKLQTSLTCNSMVLFDHVGCLKKYDTVLDILRDFFELRLKYYGLRKEWLLGMLGAESAKLNNQARFILEKIDGKIIIENKPKKELIKVLIQRGYDSDPVKAWKEAQQKVPDEEENEESDNEKESEKSDSVTDSGPTFNYLLDMPLWYLTKEKKDELCRLRNEKEQELDTLKRKSPSDLWKEDLAAFIEELEAVEAKEKQDEQVGLPGKGGKAKGKKAQMAEVLPSPSGQRVIPRITIEMKADAEKKSKKKIKNENTEGSPQEDGMELEGLKQRLEKKQKREPGTKTKKQTTLPFKPIKKGKKRNPWSDSESDRSSDESNFDVPPRETEPRRAATKTKFTVDLDSDEDFSDFDEKTQDEDFVPSDASPPKTKTSPKLNNKEPKPQKSATSDLEGDDAKDSVPLSSSPPATHFPDETEITNPVPKKNVTVKKTAAKSQSSTTTTGAKKRAAPKGTKKDPALNSGVSQKPDPVKTKNRRKRKPSTSDDSDSNFEKIVSKAVTSKKSKGESDDFHMDFDSAPAPRAKSGRAKKPITYLEESDEDDLF